MAKNVSYKFNEKERKRLYEVADKLASANDGGYTTVQEILEDFYGDRRMLAVEKEGIYNRLLKRLKENSRFFDFEDETLKFEKGFHFKKGTKLPCIAKKKEYDRLKERERKKLYDAIDELASINDENSYTTIDAILWHCYKEKISTGDTRREFLRQRLDENRKFFDLKGKTFRSGFRFKMGIRAPFFAGKKDDKIYNSKEGSAKTLFMTGGLEMLLDEETATEHRIELECIGLTNLDLIKKLSEYVGKKKVISFRYRRNYEEVMFRTVHPHRLIQYNGRWFLFAYVEQSKNKNVDLPYSIDEYDVVPFSIDRILTNFRENLPEKKRNTNLPDDETKYRCKGCIHNPDPDNNNLCESCKIKPKTGLCEKMLCVKNDKPLCQQWAFCPNNNNIPFRDAPKKVYEEYFRDIVGVTRILDHAVEEYTIRTTNKIVDNLIESKPIHHSQHREHYFDMEKGYGEITIKVRWNIELQTKILSYGSGVYVVGDGDFQRQLRKAIVDMVRNYLSRKH